MPSSPRVLLLNPPGKGAIIRDYFCSKTSRTGYLFAPIALLHAGAVFAAGGFKVQVLDAVALGLGAEECLARIEALRPDCVFALVGAVSVAADRDFLNALRARIPGLVLLGCGDVLLEGAEAWVAQGTLDAAVLDFDLPGMVDYARGAASPLPGPLPGIVGRFGDQVLSAPVPRQPVVSVGLPPHELFLGYGYRYPFARRRPFAGVLTDFGCPFSCSFCVMSGLAYHRRPMDEVAAELRHLEALGVREFMLWDQTFAAKREWALEFLEALPARRMGWTCFTRPDRIDADLARQMAHKGCHTAIMGVETANPETLRAMRKGFTPEQARTAFAACRAAGIATVATVIVGLPGEGPADVEKTLRLILDMDPDYLSVHTAVPRAGTGLRAGMAASGLASASCEAMDQSGEECVLASDSMSAEEILRLRRSFNRRFYARPHYLARTALRLLSRPGMLLDQVRQGLTLLGRNRQTRGAR